jgi:tetraacyldisaccharide 4'-kinase
MLWPASALYAAASRARIWCYQRGIFHTQQLPGMVISVGNLTVGGTGKTPMVIWLAEQFAAEGRHTAILTRGYRGTAPSDGGEPQSDEVAMLRNRLGGKVELGVGADRFKNGEILARHGADCFILDDGFQHVKLARNVNIVLVDATDPFGGGMVLPTGRLREPISALCRADIVVITRATGSPAPAIEAMIRRHCACPIFYAKTRFDGLLELPALSAAAHSKNDWCTRYFAFCAVGNPSAFYSDLSKWGFQLAGERSFPDHHSYTQKEFDELVVSAENGGATAMLCTEKDVWNLRNVTFKGMPVVCCRISMELPTPEFRDAIESALIRGRGKAAR